MNHLNGNTGKPRLIDELVNQYIQVRIKQSELGQQQNEVFYIGRMIGFDDQDILLHPYVRYEKGLTDKQLALSKLSKLEDSLGNVENPEKPKGIHKSIIAEWNGMDLPAPEDLPEIK